MLGIDIVDLKDEKSKQRDTRSLRLVQCSKDVVIDHPEIYWLLWSAKEAIFKCRREAINFSPTKIPVEISEKDGKYFFCSEQLKGEFIINEEYILAVCSDYLDQTEYHVFKNNGSIHSSKIRDMIIDYFQQQNIDFKIGADELNLPTLLPSREPISISHHNHLGAFAYSKSILKK